MSDPGKSRHVPNRSDGVASNVVWLHDHAGLRTRPPIPDDAVRGKLLLFTGVIYVQGAPEGDGTGRRLGAEPGAGPRRRRRR